MNLLRNYKKKNNDSDENSDKVFNSSDASLFRNQEERISEHVNMLVSTSLILTMMLTCKSVNLLSFWKYNT